MTGADWAIVAIILVSVIQAASVGFFQEVFGIAGLVCGYLLAAWNYQRLAVRFEHYLPSAAWLIEIGAFLVIFLGVMLAAGIAGKIARWVMREAGLTPLDRFLGGVIGLLRGALIVAVVLVGMTAFTPTSQYLQGSEMAPYFLVVGRAAIWVAPSGLRMRFYQGLDLLRREQRNM